VLIEILFISLGPNAPLDADIRLARRIRRDTVERGRDISSVLDQVIYMLYFYLWFIFTPITCFFFLIMYKCLYSNMICWHL